MEQLFQKPFAELIQEVFIIFQGLSCFAPGEVLTGPSLFVVQPLLSSESQPQF